NMIRDMRLGSGSSVEIGMRTVTIVMAAVVEVAAVEVTTTTERADADSMGHADGMTKIVGAMMMGVQAGLKVNAATRTAGK
ncbi:unnamed protein product, partial [Rhizoctonia solani]